MISCFLHFNNSSNIEYNDTWLSFSGTKCSWVNRSWSKSSWVKCPRRNRLGRHVSGRNVSGRNVAGRNFSELNVPDKAWHVCKEPIGWWKSFKVPKFSIRPLCFMVTRQILSDLRQNKFRSTTPFYNEIFDIFCTLQSDKTLFLDV